MTVTNTSEGGHGIYMMNATVELMDVASKGCSSVAFFIYTPTSENSVVATRCEFANSRWGALVNGSCSSATFKNCVFKDNEYDGVYGCESTVHLHGEATAVHSNGRNGIHAYDSAKVVIHLPSHHNTSYNNTGDDRKTNIGGSITNVED